MDYQTDFLCTPEGVIYSIRKPEIERHVAEIEALNGGVPLANIDEAQSIVAQLNMRKEMAEQGKRNNEKWIIDNAKLFYEIKVLRRAKRKGKK